MASPSFAFCSLPGVSKSCPRAHEAGPQRRGGQRRRGEPDALLFSREVRAPAITAPPKATKVANLSFDTTNMMTKIREIYEAMDRKSQTERARALQRQADMLQAFRKDLGLQLETMEKNLSGKIDKVEGEIKLIKGELGQIRLAGVIVVVLYAALNADFRAFLVALLKYVAP